MKKLIVWVLLTLLFAVVVLTTQVTKLDSIRENFVIKFFLS